MHRCISCPFLCSFAPQLIDSPPRALSGRYNPHPSRITEMHDMHGKRSHPLFGTTGKVNLNPLGDDHHNNTVDTQVSRKHSSVPQHVTIGFEIPQETKPPDACESPRSVLDVNVTSEKHLHGRSFRSYAQALPLRNKGSQGIGLAIIVDIHAEEKGQDYSFLHPGHDSASLCVRRQHPDELNSYSLSSQTLHTHRHQHQQSQPITIVANCHTQVQPSALNSSKDAKIFSLNVADEDDDDDHSISLGSMEFFGSDYMSSWPECVAHNRTGCKVDDNGFIMQPSIFTVASVPSEYGSYGIRSTSFLEVCAFCQQDFAPGKDIFMYRGDQAFCSTECRGERIKIDEYKEKLTTMNS